MGIQDWSNPENFTHELFTIPHIIFICIMVVLLVGFSVLFWYKKINETALYITLTCITFLTTIIILIYSIVNSSYNLEWFLPLHICNVFQIIFLLCSIFKNGVRNFLKEYIFYFGVIGCVVGNAVPVTSLYYFDAFELVPVCLFVYHMCLGIAGVYVWFSKTHVLRLFNIWKAIVILIPILIGAIVCNTTLNTDFLALNMSKPIPGFNMLMTAFKGFYPYFLVGGVLLVMISVMMLGFGFEKIKSKLISEVSKSEGFKKFLKVTGISSLKISIVTFVKKSPKYSKLFLEYKERFFNSDFYREIKENGVLDKIKNMTIEQVCSPKYLFSLCKETHMFRHLFSFIRFRNFKKEISYIKNYEIA